MRLADAPAAGMRLTDAPATQAIEARRAQETECFLRACAVRLGLEAPP